MTTAFSAGSNRQDTPLREVIKSRKPETLSFQLMLEIRREPPAPSLPNEPKLLPSDPPALATEPGNSMLAMSWLDAVLGGALLVAVGAEIEPVGLSASGVICTFSLHWLITSCAACCRETLPTGFQMKVQSWCLVSPRFETIGWVLTQGLSE